MNDEPEKIDWLDSSKMADWNLCQRYYYYRHEEQLQPNDVPLSSALLFGTAIHHALENIYGSDVEMVACPCGNWCLFCNGQQIPKSAALFLAHYPKDPENQKDLRTRARGLDILREYTNKYKNDSFTVEAVEVPFRVKVKENLELTGRIDMVIREGKLKPLDHKTTSKRLSDPGYVLAFKLSPQPNFYIFATQQITGEPCDSAVINVCGITSTITDESFIRFETNRSPEEMAEWMQEVLSLHRRLLENRRTGIWPKSAPYACTSYNQRCMYWSLCSANEQTRENIKQYNFHKQEWNPLGENNGGEAG